MMGDDYSAVESQKRGQTPLVRVIPRQRVSPISKGSERFESPWTSRGVNLFLTLRVAALQNIRRSDPANIVTAEARHPSCASRFNPG